MGFVKVCVLIFFIMSCYAMYAGIEIDIYTKRGRERKRRACLGSGYMAWVKRSPSRSACRSPSLVRSPPHLRMSISSVHRSSTWGRVGDGVGGELWGVGG